jgi:hypothetical protein
MGTYSGRISISKLRQENNLLEQQFHDRAPAPCDFKKNASTFQIRNIQILIIDKFQPPQLWLPIGAAEILMSSFMLVENIVTRIDPANFILS